MVRPAYRSRSLRRVHVRIPSGVSVVHYERRKNDVPHCAICGRPLQGFPKLVKGDHSGHRPPGRPYAGNICHACLRRLLKAAIRSGSS